MAGCNLANGNSIFIHRQNGCLDRRRVELDLLDRVLAYVAALARKVQRRALLVPQGAVEIIGIFLILAVFTSPITRARIILYSPFGTNASGEPKL